MYMPIAKPLIICTLKHLTSVRCPISDISCTEVNDETISNLRVTNKERDGAVFIFSVPHGATDVIVNCIS